MPTKYTLYWHIHQPMTPVKNPEKLPLEFIMAWKALDRAEIAYYKAQEAYDRAAEAYLKAREAYAPKIEKLHKEEHPACLSGGTIFSKRVD